MQVRDERPVEPKHDLTHFGLSDMIECGSRLRRCADNAFTMEEAANSMVRFLHTNLVDDAGETATALVRFYKTRPFPLLPADLQDFARGIGGQGDWDRTRCLTLLATAGDLLQWNSRKASRSHQAIPLHSPAAVEEAPMIAQLIRQFGLEIPEVVEPDPHLLLDLEQRAYNVFYVPEALGSADVPAQKDFVVPHGIRSVIGFGGVLVTGDLFAIVMFTKIHVPAETAQMFRTLALNAKMSVQRFCRTGRVFESDDPRETGEVVVPLPPQPVNALQQLLDVLESSALQHAGTLEEANRQLETTNGRLEALVKENRTLFEQARDALAERDAALWGAELERSRLREVFRKSPGCIFVTDGPDHLIDFANPAFLDRFECKECIGAPARDALGEHDRLCRMIDEAYRGEGPVEATELPFAPAGDGENAFFNLFLVPFRAPGGEVAGVLGHAIDVTDTVRARVELETITTDLQQVAEASLAMNSAHTLEETLQVVTEQAARILGAHQCAATVTVEKNFEQWVSASYLSDKYSQWQHLTPTPHGEGIYTVVVETNSPMRLTQEQLLSHPRWRGFSDFAHGHPPIRGWLAAPLTDREGRNAGVLHLSDRHEGEFTAKDEAILVQIARFASVAVENARLYEMEHSIAETLQRSLLPEKLPALPGVEMAVRYVAGGTGVSVGGDWYDAIPLPGGCIALVLGDVVGKGVLAASGMAQIRMAMRAYALEERSPAALIQRIDRLIQRVDPNQMATLVCMVVDPERGTVQLSNAGHPPPLLVCADGSSSFVEGGRSVPIGVMPHAPHQEIELSFDPGSKILLYSDGLVEQRTKSIDDGMGLLRHTASIAPDDLEGLSDHILETMVSKRPSDDVALLVFRRIKLTPDNLTLRVQAEPSVLSSARHTLRAWLEECGAEPGVIYELTTAFGEACANAIEHAYGPADGRIEVEGSFEGDEVRVCVQDFGTWRPSRPGDRGRGMQIMQAFCDVADVDATPDGTRVTLRRRLDKKQ
ncbi:MAG TPA: SpoIIE family protein phosphatase [Actinomycetota bacterium]|nr:SpoIIE family protein phosphatase [Actinomycetota bacterium]